MKIEDSLSFIQLDQEMISLTHIKARNRIRFKACHKLSAMKMQVNNSLTSISMFCLGYSVLSASQYFESIGWKWFAEKLKMCYTVIYLVISFWCPTCVFKILVCARSFYNFVNFIQYFIRKKCMYCMIVQWISLLFRVKCNTSSVNFVK